MTTPDPRASDVHNTLIELLQDGQWHDYHVILAHAAKTVQPGQAIRQCEADRLLSLSHRGKPVVPERTRKLSTSDQIRAGSRSIVQKRLLNKAFEIDPPGTQPFGTRKKVRLRVRTLEELVRVHSSRRAPYTQAVMELLLDGRWHKLDEVLEVGMKLVPEDRAVARATRNRLRHTVSREQSIRTGAHAIVYDSLMHNQLVEIDRSGATPRIRLRA